jgi:hypothetical protein
MPAHAHELSLNAISGQKVVDVYGYVSTEFGDPVFKLTRIELEDGTTLDVEGEHDMPYIPDGLTLPPEVG